MTTRQKPKFAKIILGMYDDMVGKLVANGFKRDETEYIVKHFFVAIASDPDSYR